MSELNPNLPKVSDLPLVSVVICTFNQQGFIRDTLDSVIAQTYSNIEIIVSDDGSSDATPNILREYAERYPDKVIAVLSETNTGIPANINRGMARRTGHYTAWLDGDDLMLPTKIEKQVAFLQQHPEATGCYHDAEVFDSDTGQTLGAMSVLYNGSPELKQGRLKDWMKPRYYFVPSSIMAHSAACPPHGFDERLKHLSEGLFFIEVFRDGLLLALNETLVRYRRHAQNVTSSQKARDLSAEYELMVYAILDARYPELHDLVKRQRIACLLTEAVKCHREGDAARSRRIIGNVIKEGAPLKAALVYCGLRLMRQRAATITSGLPYQRPGWINCIARSILE
jgi:glycosyltransferase involved in cell wall biosynthesis